jgi:quaternary ammonium compound-resistance protein SugE
MAWLLLFVASACEVAFALSIKPADGFSRLWPSLAVVAFAAISVVLLSKTLDRLPLGTAYAAWTGLGSVGTVLAGIVLFGEPVTAARIACLALIIAGVAGLRLLGAG